MKDIKDIAMRYNMDEEALTARLKALHERYLDNEKQYNELLDEAAYQGIADKLKTQASNLKTTLKNTPEHMRHYLAGDWPHDWADQLIVDLEHLQFLAQNMVPTVKGHKSNFHRDRLVGRIEMAFRYLTNKKASKKVLTAFATDVFHLWELDPKGIEGIITKLRRGEI